MVTVFIFVLGTFSLGFIIPQGYRWAQSLLVGPGNYFYPLVYVVGRARLSPSPDVLRCVLTGVLAWVLGVKGIAVFSRRRAIICLRSSRKPTKRRTEKYPAHSGMRRDAAGAAVRGDAFGAVVHQILSQLAVLLYLICTARMFSAAIVLRYKMKNTDRPFRLGKGNGLMWFWAVWVLPAAHCWRFVLSYRAQPDLDQRQHRMVLGTDYRLW